VPRLLKKYFSSHGIIHAVITLILTAETWNISQDIPRGTSICCQSGIGADFFSGHLFHPLTVINQSIRAP